MENPQRKIEIVKDTPTKIEPAYNKAIAFCSMRSLFSQSFKEAISQLCSMQVRLKVMSKIEVIGIALIPSERINLKVEELVTVRISISPRGEYFFPLGEKEVFDTLLKEILKEQNTSTLSIVFLAVDIAQRRRRRRRAKAQKSTEEYSSTGGVS